MPYYNNKHFAELANIMVEKAAGRDMVRRNYVTVTLHKLHTTVAGLP